MKQTVLPISKPQRLKRYHVVQAIKELSTQGEFTQFELHDKIAELMGRPLTPVEKEKATQIAKYHVQIKDIKRKGPYKIKVYIFML